MIDNYYVTGLSPDSIVLKMWDKMNSRQKRKFLSKPKKKKGAKLIR